MTAEIAVMNRRAVVFAADSTMTISATGKTYNSADKIFDISSHNPIGMMLYNALDYMGMPLDVLIKDFRESAYCKPFAKLEEAPEAFFEYLAREFRVMGEDEDIHVDSLVTSVYSVVHRRFMRAISQGKEPSSYQEVFLSTVSTLIHHMESLADCECFYDYTLEDFLDRYDYVFEIAIQDVFGMFPLEDTEKAPLKRLAGLSLIKTYYSQNQTGFVFAGFGKSELFPSLRSFIFDGMIMGRLKRAAGEIVSIDANQVRAKIVPFAQHEMVDRFLVGIDERHERTILANVRQNLQDLGNSLIDALPRIRRSTRERLREGLRDSVETVLSDLRDNTIEELKAESAAESEDAVMFMAKSDLANFAEALVNITSVKRRASLETESVGGPIDVAVVSRDDGFIWVSRKHYFNADLNPRFFARKYGTMSQRHGGQNDGPR